MKLDALDDEVVVELPGGEPCAHRRQARGIVDLVAVDAEDPRVRADVGQEAVVRDRRVVDRLETRVRELGREASEDLRRPVARAVVEEQELVAKLGDVPHRPLDEEILVAHEHDADNRRIGHRPKIRRG
ncbi:MAG: hypothetical protein E6G33_16040 [Actinobacteria bacterium]|nr:MAG: hypothetical protein E6G33_16040 [Actinomycetota bacterium]